LEAQPIGCAKNLQNTLEHRLRAVFDAAIGPDNVSPQFDCHGGYGTWLIIQVLFVCTSLNFEPTVRDSTVNGKGCVIIMAKAKMGDMVRVNYEGKLKDGSVFGSSLGGEPLQFKIGDNQLIQAFEEAVVGMDLNESKTIEVLSEDAFGNYRDDLVLNIDKSQLPPDFEPKIGEKVELMREEVSFSARITDIVDDAVTLDINHPLAGKDLIFDIELLEILQA
jgi:peptidylprolyl isomerase